MLPYARAYTLGLKRVKLPTCGDFRLAFLQIGNTGMNV